MYRRVISALFLILITLPLILVGEKPFALLVGIVGIFALKEILDLNKSHNKIPLIISFLYYICLLFIMYMTPLSSSNLGGINYSFIALMLILYLIPCLFYENNRYSSRDAFYFLGVTLFLGVACHSIIMIRAHSLLLFLYLILIPIFTDTFAYILGTLIGKHKITNISPKKTWEGSILGMICATILSCTFYVCFLGNMDIVSLLILTILLSVTSQVGDLLFSLIKRENSIKDYSDLIPGHGGILDRFDSLIFVSVIFILFIQFI